MAFIYFARHGETAVPRFCAALRRFATAHGVPGKYRHDLTLDYLERVRTRACASGYADSEQFLSHHPELLRG